VAVEISGRGAAPFVVGADEEEVGRYRVDNHHFRKYSASINKFSKFEESIQSRNTDFLIPNTIPNLLLLIK
jgi:hypothetical protein